MKNLQTMRQSVQKGFTLIELMIVVAIIGILAAIAIPAYTDYTIKSRVSEGASLSGNYRTAMDVYFSENGVLSGVNVATGVTLAELGLTNSDGTAVVTKGEYVSSVTLNIADPVSPFLEVNYRTSTALGDASGDCINYFPVLPTANTGGNLIWVPRATDQYTTKSGRVVPIAACTTATGIVPSKYRPKI